MSTKNFIEEYKTYLFIAGAVILFGFYQMTEEESSPELLMTEEEPVEQSEPSKAQETLPEPAVLMVDIKGAVRTPGIYSLRSGERINDAVAKAGGFQKEADQAAVNLAQKLQDEMVIYVPKVGETPPAELAATITTAGTTKERAQTKSSESDVINLNTATIEELQKLPGIGEAKAQAIIDYRETTGAFSKPEDLKNVSGIGEKTFEKLSALITVQ